MIFLSAQPASLYFKWQLEVQLFNFERFNIDPNNIHVLFSFNRSRIIDPRVLSFVEENKNKARFYFYEDTRPNTKYVSTIRPHILKKHFNAHPFLERECIFYHDSDIIFRDLPDFKRLIKSDVWYFSNTNSYLSSTVINQFGPKVLKEMCDIVGIDPMVVNANAQDTGGAQYLIKNVHAQFWNKVEIDSNNLFNYLDGNKDRLAKLYTKYSEGLQIPNLRNLQQWCADMWALLWNSWLYNKTVKIDSELNFCWAIDSIEQWSKVKILHNAGVESHQSNYLFFKNNYQQFVPYDMDLSYVDKRCCSKIYVDEVIAFKLSKRASLIDVTFILKIIEPTKDEILILKIVLAFLSNNINTNFVIYEYGELQQIDKNEFPKNVVLHFEQNYVNSDAMRIENLDDYNTPIVCLYNFNSIITIAQILDCVDKLRKNACTVAYPFDGTIVSIDKSPLILKFKENLDINLFEYFNSSEIKYKSFAGSMFININNLKGSVIRFKSQNSHFDNIKIIAQLVISNHKVYRSKGKLFNLNYCKSNPMELLESNVSIHEMKNLLGIVTYSPNINTLESVV